MLGCSLSLLILSTRDCAALGWVYDPYTPNYLTFSFISPERPFNELLSKILFKSSREYKFL